MLVINLVVIIIIIIIIIIQGWFSARGFGAQRVSTIKRWLVNEVLGVLIILPS
jgi:hypothetical protein